jgi:hypothetical protein
MKRTAQCAVFSAALLLTVLLSAPAWAVQATGFGVDRDHALTNAFQKAIEAAIGVDVKSHSLVDNFMLIKDEIITHSKGYVRSYEIVREGPANGGGYEMTIDAQVDRGAIGDHIQTLDILMKMAGHPRLLIFGTDDDLESVPANGELFAPLVRKVSEVFAEQFRFEVVDWATMHSKYPRIPGRMTPEHAAKYNNKLRCDMFVAVKLNLEKGNHARLVLKGVRISDNQLLGQSQREVQVKGLDTMNVPARYRRAVEAARDVVFQAAADLARDMVAGIQSEVEQGKGLRYTLGFYEFPDQDLLTRELGVLPGYVRHEVKRSDSVNLELAYWSNLKPGQLFERIRDMLETKHQYRLRSKQDGRVLKYKWENPEGF